jgi:hypothetical protein
MKPSFEKPMFKRKVKYRTVKIPETMILACQTIIRAHPECKWGSIAEFVRDAIRHYCYWEKHTLAKLQ